MDKKEIQEKPEIFPQTLRLTRDVHAGTEHRRAAALSSSYSAHRHGEVTTSVGKEDRLKWTK
jgi:hypothetical protein